MRTSLGFFLVALIIASCGSAAGGGTGVGSAEPEQIVAASPTLTTTPPPPTPRPTPRPTPAPSPLCPAVEESSLDANQIVLSTANIFGAGRDFAPAPGGGGTGVLPPVWPLPADTAAVTVICAMGSVVPIRSDGRANGPDGDHIGRTDVESFDGISGILHATNGMFLTGVFLGDAEPADPAPDRLDFSDGEAFEALSPKVGQTFLVGDGIGRRYVVPAGATRLFLGFADASRYQGKPGWYGNNTGYLGVTLAVSE